MEDWRILDQEEYLTEREFEFRKYKPIEPNNDHDHCEFCTKKLYHEMIDDYCATEGYVTMERQGGNTVGGVWVCVECFNDFKKRFRFRVV